MIAHLPSVDLKLAVLAMLAAIFLRAAALVVLPAASALGRGIESAIDRWFNGRR